MLTPAQHAALFRFTRILSAGENSHSSRHPNQSLNGENFHYGMIFCRNGELNPVIDKIISDGCDFLLNSIHFAPVSIILTGSFSRGEGSVYRSKERLVVLGDIEFLVYCQRGDRHLARRIADAGKIYSRRLKEERGIKAEIEFSMCTDAFFAGLRPTIFNLELLGGGKVLSGDTGILKRLGRIKKQDIESAEGFYLVCNRMVEQLINLDGLLQKKPGAPEKTAYSNIKLYLDIPTAILATINDFEAGYQKRLDLLLEKHWNLACHIFGSEQKWHEIAEAVTFWTDFKLHPMPLEKIYQKKFSATGLDFEQQIKKVWTELIPVVKKIWEWQVNTIGSGGGYSSYDAIECRRMLPIPSGKWRILKEWIKIFLRSRKGAAKTHINWRQALKGSPRHMIYQGASALYFLHHDILSGTAFEDSGKFADIHGILPVEIDHSGLVGEQKNEASRLRGAVYDNWVFHVRNN